MSEKVLGFKEKEAKRLLKKVSKEFGKGYPYIIEHDFELLEIIEYMLKQQASESVDLKWLEDKVKKGLTKRPKKIIEYHKIKAKDKKTFLTLGYRTALYDLLSAVRAKAKEVKK